MNARNKNITTTGVLEELRSSGYPTREWGKAIDGSPMLGVQIGGKKKPSIFVTAGSHSVETGGIHGALEMVRSLDTEHEVHILPLRDPLGFAGISRCVSVALGRNVEISSHNAAREFLEANGDLLYEKDDLQLYKLGTMGFAWDIPRPGMKSFLSMHTQMIKLTHEKPETLQPLLGLSTFLITSMPEIEGSEDLRCWHGVVSTKGEWLHLNRFFGRPDAPPEVEAVETILTTVNPGLVCDLHEGFGSGFWMPTRKPSDKESERVVVEMTVAFFDYINGQGYQALDYEEFAATHQKFNRGYPTSFNIPVDGIRGMFWTDGVLRNEGFNLSDYVNQRTQGIAYGTEAPAAQPLEVRVDGIANGIEKAIRCWERSLQ